MGKKLICFPFVNGDLREYSPNNLDNETREKVYAGELVEIVFPNGEKELWKPNEEIELTLRYKGYGRGRSAVTFYWIDQNGYSYPMFIKDFDELVKLNIGTSEIHGTFTYIKRGANYGIKFLKK